MMLPDRERTNDFTFKSKVVYTIALKTVVICLLCSSPCSNPVTKMLGKKLTNSLLPISTESYLGQPKLIPQTLSYTGWFSTEMYKSIQ